MPALPHHVMIQEPTRTTNSFGEVEVGYADLYGCWTSIKTISAKERLANDQVSHLSTHVLTLRFDSRLTTAHRIKFGSRVFAVDGLINKDERSRELLAMCYEVREG